MFIYKIINNKTNKLYIGQSKNPHKRFINHFYDKGSPFYKICRKDLLLEILEETNSGDEREIYYIEFYNTLYPFGYNKQTGGRYGYKVSNDTKNKLSKGYNKTREQQQYARSKLIMTDEIKNKISNSLKGREKSDEHKDKMRKPKGDKFKEKCKIVQKKTS